MVRTLSQFELKRSKNHGDVNVVVAQRHQNCFKGLCVLMVVLARTLDQSGLALVDDALIHRNRACDRCYAEWRKSLGERFTCCLYGKIACQSCAEEPIAKVLAVFQNIGQQNLRQLRCQLSRYDVGARGHPSAPKLRHPIIVICRQFKASKAARSKFDSYVFRNVHLSWPADFEPAHALLTKSQLHKRRNSRLGHAGAGRCVVTSSNVTIHEPQEDQRYNETHLESSYSCKLH